MELNSTSLHPPSFHRNDFSTCSTHFSWGKSHFSLRARRFYARAHAYADNAPSSTCVTHVHKWRRSVPAVEEPHDLPYGEEKNDRSVSVHTSVDCGDVW